MSTPRIIIPTDFSDPANNALRQAVELAKVTECPLTLLHIADEDHPNEGEEEAKKLSEHVRHEHLVEIDYALEPGDLFEDVGRMAQKHHARFVVIGTNGIRGLKQQLFGARILRVLRQIVVPTIVLQDDTPVLKSFNKILMPVDDIEPFENKVSSVIPFAKYFDSEVMLYAIHHPMKDEKKVRAHIELARKMLSDSGVRFSETEESPTVFSAGIAKQTLAFAKQWGAELIAISLAETENKGNLNQVDCERIINNEARIAVLCAPERLDRQRFFS